MKKKTQLDDVDVIFDSTPLTEAEKQLISKYIQEDKDRIKSRHGKKPRLSVKRTETGLLR